MATSGSNSGGNNGGNNNDQIVYYLDLEGFLRPVVTRDGAFMPATANMPTYNGFLAAQVDRAVAVAATAAAETQKREQMEGERKRKEERNRKEEKRKRKEEERKRREEERKRREEKRKRREEERKRKEERKRREEKRKRREEERKRKEEERKHQLEVVRLMSFYVAYCQLQEENRQPIRPPPANQSLGEIAGFEWFYRQPDGSYSLRQ